MVTQHFIKSMCMCSISSPLRHGTTADVDISMFCFGGTLRSSRSIDLYATRWSITRVRIWQSRSLSKCMYLQNCHLGIHKCCHIRTCGTRTIFIYYTIDFCIIYLHDQNEANTAYVRQSKALQHTPCLCYRQTGVIECAPGVAMLSGIATGAQPCWAIFCPSKYTVCVGRWNKCPGQTVCLVVILALLLLSVPKPLTCQKPDVVLACHSKPERLED